MTRPRSSRLIAAILLAMLLVGCGTTRMTDSPCAATEMLLVSQAADNAVAQIDFSPMVGKTVFLDASGIEKEIIDKGYLVSLVKQQLVAAGALLQDERVRAEYVVDLAPEGWAPTGIASSSAHRPCNCRASSPASRRTFPKSRS